MQSMKETIQYDACSENNWDLRNSAYPASNACGQLGQSYQVIRETAVRASSLFVTVGRNPCWLTPCPTPLTMSASPPLI